MSTKADGAPLEAERALPVPAQHPSQSSPRINADNHGSSEHKEDTASVQDDKTNNAPPFLHSPPDSNNAPKSDASDSELSELEDEPTLDGTPLPTIPQSAQDASQEPQTEANEEPEDIGEVLPDHWSGKVPVFKPTMYQFKDFQRFMAKVDSYGMKSGIIKIIPPKEWKDAQPPLDDLVKQVRVREPIKQDIMGSNGTYRQVNILHGRSYNVPQWRQLCEKSEHQPPARRGERRANADAAKLARAKAAATAAPKPPASSTPKKRGRGRPARGRGKKVKAEEEERPMTPVSPKTEATEPKEESMASIEQDMGENDFADEPAPAPRRMGAVKSQSGKTQSVSARRKFSKREGSAMIDEEAFKGFDYQLDTTEYTPERCEELERSYWKTLTYAQPLYGADMMGTLFDDRTDNWNLNKLPNILDVLGSKVPGVNTAYLYLGMWKATFAWHLEDVDLYSINYLHFGAPKQWYSISQADAKRFEGAMKNIWPADAKACPQFLRHKGFLISPQHLLQNYNIKVNKVVSYPGEFVVTYPYGYHSGYNLGYNCAEAVNFALEPWLEMGKIAKKCECAQAQDSVWIDVHAIERKLRGEETEYEETEDEEEDEEDDEMSGLPSPPASHGVKFKQTSRKRKRGPGEKGPRVKKIKLRLKAKAEPPCCLCPNDYAGLDLLPTEDGRKAHRMCALYIPETYIEAEDEKEVVYGVTRVHKDRLDLKCLFCRSKRGACFQCSQKKCARAYHPSCAAAAGVFVEEQEVPVFGEDGTEYKEQAFEFSCRFHRTKRDKKVDSLTLEDDSRIYSAAAAVKVGEICQMQLHKGEIFAGIVVENRIDEQTLLLDIIPTGDRVEVEWKWLLLADPADYHLPKASAKAIPLPASQKAKDRLNAKRADDKPRKDDYFGTGLTWAEFHDLDVVNVNKDQVKVDFSKEHQIWHYLGKGSTDARAQYTEDPSKPRFNPKGNFLDTIPKPPPKPRAVSKPQSQYRQYQGSAPFQTGNQYYTGGNAYHSPAAQPGKPYMYKPKAPAASDAAFTPQRFVPSAGTSHPALQHGVSASPVNSTSGQFAQQRFEVGGQQVTRHQSPTNGGQQQQMTSKWRIPASGTSSAHVGSSSPSHNQPVPHAQQRPPSKPTWQVHSSIYQQYPFFQSNHNRDSSKYRTPYSPNGGFTNGWGDNHGARGTTHQSNVRHPTSSNKPGQDYSTAPMSGQLGQGQWRGTSSPMPASQPPTSASQGGAQRAPVPPPTATWSTAPQNTPSQNASRPPPPLKQAVLGLANTANASLSTTGPASAPSKQSAVPLPPHIMAAMKTTSTATPNHTKDKASPTAHITPPASEGTSQSSAAVLPTTAAKQVSPSQRPGVGKISTSPVPIPAFKVLTPHQNAAQMALSQRAQTSQSPVSGSLPAQKIGGESALQVFPDVPAGSMDFVERLMGNLRRVTQQGSA